MFKIPLFDLSSVFYTSCAKKEPYLFIGKTHKFKNCLNLMTLDYTVLCVYETQQKIDMQILMDAPTVFDKYKVNLEDMVTLQERKNSFNHQLNQERLEFEKLRKEAKEKSNELDRYRDLKQYVENQLSSNRTAICEYQHIKKSRNAQKPL